jgi:AraC-like DNA-binding protein/mannose-6-phosphate isomerase-like protein (cupin superfamily)
MKQGQDIAAEYPGLVIIHQKIKVLTKDRHAHHEHEFFLPLQGEIRVRVGEKVLKAGPGKMIYLPPETDHAFESSAAGQGERLILLVQASAWKAREGVSVPAKVADSSQLAKELLFHLLIHPKTKAGKALIDTLLVTLSETLEAASGAEGLRHLSAKAGDARILRAVDYIETNFREPLSMEEIARHSGLGLRTLNRLFLDELSLSPKQLVTLYRMEEAKRLLEKQKLSVTDVALEVGYASLSQFIHSFRKVTGKLPSDYL